MNNPFSCFRFEEDLDDYSVIMVKALADRLAEVSILKVLYLYIYFETPFKLVLYLSMPFPGLWSVSIFV